MTEDSGSPSTRDAVLAAARDVIAEVGVDELRLKDVSRRAGLTTGAIYAHFESRADLVAAVAIEDLQSFTQSSAAAAEAARSGEMVDFVAVINGFLRPEIVERRRRWVYVLASANFSESVRETAIATLDEVHRALTDVVIRGQQLGQVRADVDPEAVATLMRSSSAGLSVFDIAGARPQDQEFVRALLTDLLIVAPTDGGSSETSD